MYLSFITAFILLIAEALLFYEELNFPNQHSMHLQTQLQINTNYRKCVSVDIISLLLILISNNINYLIYVYLFKNN